jgi:hypothetical protein
MLDDGDHSIEDDEIIVRFILSPYHVKNGKLRKEAFHPKRGASAVSVARHRLLGDQGCKAKAKEIVTPNGKYAGMAVIKASDIRSCDCTVEDARRDFYGHAHLDLGFIVPIGDPLPAEDLKKLHDREKKLVSHARYVPDPNPDSERWAGPSLAAQR